MVSEAFAERKIEAGALKAALLDGDVKLMVGVDDGAVTVILMVLDVVDTPLASLATA